LDKDNGLASQRLTLYNSPDYQDTISYRFVMSEKKDITHALNDYSKDFSTGTALRLWLFFLFSFYFLGYPIFLSIFLGAVGGLAGGVVFGWWKSTDGPLELPTAKAEKPKKPKELEETPPKVGGLRLAKQRRDAKTHKRSPGVLPSFKFFGKKDQ
jgi:hypothetical protein